MKFEIAGCLFAGVVFLLLLVVMPLLAVHLWRNGSHDWAVGIAFMDFFAGLWLSAWASQKR